MFAGAIIAGVIWLVSSLTAKPYPREWEQKEEDDFMKKSSENQ